MDNQDEMILPIRKHSFTAISRFLSCQQAYKLHYVDGVRTDASPAMNKGILLHQAIAAHLKGQSGIQIIMDSPPQEDIDPSELALIFNNYVAFLGNRYETHVLPDGIPMVEFQVEHDNCMAYVDWVAKDKETDSLWIIDHKVKSSISKVEHRVFDLQAIMYAYMLEQKLGIKVAGCQVNQIKSMPPKEPSRNKDGAMSRTKIATDWATYKKALLSANLNPADYTDMQEKLADAVFFQETRTYFSPEYVQTVWNEVVQPTYMAMDKMRDGLTKPLLNLGMRTCPSCSVNVYCQNALMGMPMIELYAEDDDETLFAF
jgi:hypothetical protein